MKCTENSRGVIISGIEDFDLAQTLDCGQSFRWQETAPGHFSGVAFSRAAEVYFENGSLHILGANEEDFNRVWRGYFDLDLSYENIRRQLSGIHPVLDEAGKYAGGIRILRQEPFEALCTFIISQNNNIKRIKGIVARLCENFGEEIGGGQFAFVTAEKLASLTEEQLAPLRAGFRARYLIDAAQKVVSGQVDLNFCFKAEYEQARAELMKIVGVGTKVADCTLLFGMHRLEAFPLDVWMKRAMKTLMPDINPEQFAPYAGIAQQYIFHYSRMHPELFVGK